MIISVIMTIMCYYYHWCYYDNCVIIIIGVIMIIIERARIPVHFYMTQKWKRLVSQGHTLYCTFILNKGFYNYI